MLIYSLFSTASAMGYDHETLIIYIIPCLIEFRNRDGLHMVCLIRADQSAVRMLACICRYEMAFI